MPAELPLIVSAAALATSALIFFSPRAGRGYHVVATALVVVAAALPLVLQPFVDPSRAAGRALWEWSAVGGPSVEAAYRVDGLSAFAIAMAVAYSGAALALTARVERRHPALAALVCALAFMSIALVVTDDLVAATVVLAIVAMLTSLALLAVAPVAATARATAYLSLGVQCWALAALLISRQGSPTFALSRIPADAITSGAIVAATLGALLFAGLYPVVAWTPGGDEGESDPGRVGSLITMPAAIAASLLLLRTITASDLDVTRIALPEVGADARLALAVVVLAAVASAVVRSRVLPRRALGVGATLLVLTAAYPAIGWSETVLAAAILTTAYAAVVSLALPEQWETVRSDLGLVALWIGIATGSPLGVAGGAIALLVRAASALTSALWLPPHRDYVVFVTGSAVFLVGAIAAGIGAATSADALTAVVGTLAALLLLGLEVVQLGRRFRSVAVPRDLDLASALVAALVAFASAVALVPAAAVSGSVLSLRVELTPFAVVAIATAAVLIAVLARTLRPILPYFEALAERSGPVMRALDPAPIAIGTFRIVEAAAGGGSAAFGAFERGAGVWVAGALIVALLLWAVR